VRIRKDLLSDDADTIADGLERLESELRKKLNRSDLLDILKDLCTSDDIDIVQRATWCTAKMGQNKVNDERILILLSGMAGNGDAQVRENVAWGIGEAAGTIPMADDELNAISLLLDDAEHDVRGMAAWAAGRLYHKCGILSDDVEEKLNRLLSDPSEYVCAAAKFALDG